MDEKLIRVVIQVKNSSLSSTMDQGADITKNDMCLLIIQLEKLKLKLLNELDHDEEIDIQGDPDEID